MMQTLYSSINGLLFTILVLCIANLSPVAVSANNNTLQMPRSEPPAPTTESLDGRRVALITGSTSGLGREVALAIGAKGDHVIVHGRNRERGLQVVEQIKKLGSTASFYAADFASMVQVRALGEAILRDYSRIDILVNNAGIYLGDDKIRRTSADGYELSLAVNYLAGFLLTRMLLPVIPRSPESRIVNVASGAQYPIDFNDPMLEKNYSGMRSYAQSKLAQIMFTFDLASELTESSIIVSTLHPATLMDTRMVRSAGIKPQSSVEDGRAAVLNLIESEGIRSGQYFDGMSPACAYEQAYDIKSRHQLRELSERLVKPLKF